MPVYAEIGNVYVYIYILSIQYIGLDQVPLMLVSFLHSVSDSEIQISSRHTKMTIAINEI